MRLISELCNNLKTLVTLNNFLITFNVHIKPFNFLNPFTPVKFYTQLIFTSYTRDLFLSFQFLFYSAPCEYIYINVFKTLTYHNLTLPSSNKSKAYILKTYIKTYIFIELQISRGNMRYL